MLVLEAYEFPTHIERTRTIYARIDKKDSFPTTRVVVAENTLSITQPARAGEINIYDPAIIAYLFLAHAARRFREVRIRYQWLRD